MSVSRCFYMIASVLSLFLSWRRYLKTHSFYLKDLCNTLMNARIIAYNLFFVFFCVQWCCLDSRQGLITGRKDLTLASMYIYIHVSYVYTPHTGNPLFHMQTSWRKLILTVSASRMRKWKSPKRFKHLVSIWLMSVLSSTNTYAPPDGKTVAMQIWPKKPVFWQFLLCTGNIAHKIYIVNTHLLFVIRI